MIRQAKMGGQATKLWAQRYPAFLRLFLTRITCAVLPVSQKHAIKKDLASFFALAASQGLSLKLAMRLWLCLSDSYNFVRALVAGRNAAPLLAPLLLAKAGRITQLATKDDMRSIFTVPASEFLVGEYIEQHYRSLDVWVPTKDSGIDLLITDPGARALFRCK